MHFRHISS